ncbi:MAG: hypothetical protein UR85_C0002G0031 [Candidatus Nomurabacteria bacterium GW2011_GWF2_35_66]|uniref:Uncharacterized protein n=1 Tax=Candidatus Nomurabacteria bacterium GW2011_GWE1_35_16 TaxID=1618761 RepID=A0A0G0BAW7_9BACT|nr:MAG: hypothetical protein UR55_C0007G0011 [Candidatus Nomurabacteria bacterium GW2011_GWF1_34_20]KKP63286.1 MAG: hypothetical protein UR57_C0006G0011 [Candidatus Nomurabacteria bacterium GW2011_GWE2_34_25]KKP66484.1 MAG: hypothetical protein UR64_C0006G0011 [Candidatus Nomurabacteria bacterium GW2011_GWE1_35_16]KKP83718.1 MAG: hypothetical protein UR85_C0002G0031 [Candidatus Nomurabacteria bacterium GW2011_GWF2_35_66]HAE36409.1 hypothetical protein [Candidatus Nomurabacteria bacterium]
MNIEEILVKNKIVFEDMGDYIATYCPFCDKSYAGYDTATLNIDMRTGYVNCSACKKGFKVEDVLEKLGINIIEKSSTTELIKINKDDSKDIDYKGSSLISVKDILALNFDPQEWLIENLIPLEGTAVISGSPGNYKSWLTQDIARCVALGTDFLENFKVKQGSVLVVDRENHLRLVKERIKKLKIPEDATIQYFKSDDFGIDNKKCFDDLISKITQFNIKLVIFDSLVRIHSGDENDAKQMSKVLQQFTKINKLGATVIFVHHHRKENGYQKSSGQSLRGSSDILAFVDTAFVVKKGKEKGCITMETLKLRQATELEPFNIDIIEDEEFIGFKYSGVFNSSKEQTEEAKEAILEILEGKKTVFNQDFEDALKDTYKKSIIKIALKELEISEIIIRKKEAHNKHSFCLKEDGVITRVDENN